MAVEKRKRHFNDDVLEPKKKSDVEAFILNVRENPLKYGLAVLVIVVALLFGLFWRANTEQRSVDVNTAYAKAIENSDPALRAAALEKVDVQGSDLAPEILYQTGEAYYQASNVEKAKAAFQTVVDKHADSKFAAMALEALGNIAEDEGKPDKALEYYQQILDKHGNTFTAMTQNLNVGRVKEKLGKLEDAVAAYKQQLVAFPKSHAASDAQEALDKLRAAHPELFPKEEAAPAVEGQAVQTPTAPATEGVELTVPEPAAPAPEAAAPAPAPEAPAAPAPEAAPAAPAPEAPAAAVPEAAPAAPAAPTEAPAPAAPAEGQPAPAPAGQ
jgi:tetratricopeptide (TPR) repeat protein